MVTTRRIVPIKEPENCILFGCYYDSHNSFHRLPTKSCSYDSSFSKVDDWYRDRDEYYDYEPELDEDQQGLDDDKLEVGDDKRVLHDAGSYPEQPPESCQKVKAPTYGEVDQDIRSAIYRCHKGYYIKGIRVLTCSGGCWIPDEPPVCVAASVVSITNNRVFMLLVSFLSVFAFEHIEKVSLNFT